MNKYLVKYLLYTCNNHFLGHICTGVYGKENFSHKVFYEINNDGSFMMRLLLKRVNNNKGTEDLEHCKQSVYAYTHCECTYLVIRHISC